MSAKSKRVKSGLKPIRRESRPGRNAPCACGSNSKYKKCCGAPRNPTTLAPYLSFTDVSKLTDVTKNDHLFIKRWGYHPGLTERSIMATGTDDEMADLVVRKLIGLAAHPKWIEAAKALKMLVTPLNVQLITKEEAEAWNSLVGDSPTELVKHCEEGCTCHQTSQPRIPTE